MNALVINRIEKLIVTFFEILHECGVVDTRFTAAAVYLLKESGETSPDIIKLPNGGVVVQPRFGRHPSGASIAFIPDGTVSLRYSNKYISDEDIYEDYPTANPCAGKAVQEAFACLIQIGISPEQIENYYYKALK